MLFLFGASIFVHELGHFWLARRRGMKIERFSIGFGPAIWKTVRDGIEYRISWIPLGGYVLLPQMNPASAIEGSIATGHDEGKNETAEPLPPATPFTKIIVALAGPAFNIAFAMLLAVIVSIAGTADYHPAMLVVSKVPTTSPEYACGLRQGDHIIRVDNFRVWNAEDVLESLVTCTEDPVQFVVQRGSKRLKLDIKPNRDPDLGVRIPKFELGEASYVTWLEPDRPAEKAGLKIGDRILTVDGEPVLNVNNLRDMIIHRAGQQLRVVFTRKGQRQEVTVTPFHDVKEDRGRIGIKLGLDPFAPKVLGHPSPLEQIDRHISKTTRTLRAMFYPKKTGVTPAKISGVPGIVVVMTREIKESLISGLNFTAFLNVGLAIFNLLPIPVIDGGHILFALFEWVRRRPLSGRVVSRTWTVFAAALIAFILYVNLNDLVRIGRSLMPRAETNTVQKAIGPPQK